MAILSTFRGTGKRLVLSAHRSWRRRAFDTALAGVATTVVVALLTAAGFLRVPEQWFYDLRTRFCSFGRPAPTTRLVHLDMDDNACRQEELGRWPWPRADQAALLNEIALAHPKAVALDVIYDAPQAIETRRTSPQGVTPATYVDIDHDAEFEAALRNLGCGIIGSSHADVQSTATHGPHFDALVALLRQHLDLTADAAASALHLDPKLIAADFLPAREAAVKLAVDSVIGDEDPTLDAVVDALTHAPPDDGPLCQLITLRYDRVRAERAILRSRFDPSRDAALNAIDDRLPDQIPLERFSNAAADTAFFTYIKSGDGSVRTIPLVTNLRGKIAVSLGLALAARTLDVPLDKLELLEDRLIIPAPSGKIEVPLRSVAYDQLPRPIGGVLELPWFGPPGPTGWLEMYGPGQTVSLVQVWHVVQQSRKLAFNNDQLRDACLSILQACGDSDQVQALGTKSFDPHDASAWAPIAAKILVDKAVQISAAFAAPAVNPGPEPKDPAAHDRWEKLIAQQNIRAAADAIPKLREPIEKLASDIATERADLRKLFDDKAILIGWTATGLTDFVTTPLHPAAPGVRVHGVVFNSILTRNFLRFAPEWLNLFLTLLLGLLMTGAVVRHSPLFSMGVAIAFSTAYAAVNAYAFGPHAYVLALAGPLASVVATWAAGSIVRYRLERAAVEAIKKRFATYVDPQLVNYLLQNPEKIGLAGERRHMTVCFTDLAGFTTLSERLGEGTVGLLNRYFNAMFPIIRRHSGYINKLLGDGMMFFYNGIEPNPRHAADAFDTVLQLQAELRTFNASLTGEGLPNVKMRVGITTGDMIAGDAGGETFADFTVLGDIVNLASRLEGANKKSGTLIICNAAARAAAGPEFLTRPIGVLRVVGKTEGIEAFEVVARQDAATPDQIALARRTEQMVAAYRNANLDECERLAALVQPADLADLYLHLCQDLRQSGIPEGFNGTIVLDSK
jgi:class 3 adenylate cyclase